MKYDYRCKDCKKRFEVEVVATSKIEGKRPLSPTCPHCKSKSVKKLITAPNVKFVGSARGGGLE